MSEIEVVTNNSATWVLGGCYVAAALGHFAGRLDDTSTLLVGGAAVLVGDIVLRASRINKRLCDPQSKEALARHLAAGEIDIAERLRDLLPIVSLPKAAFSPRIGGHISLFRCGSGARY